MNISSVTRLARAGDGAEADAGEDVGVVALARHEASCRRASPDRTGCRRRTARGRRSSGTPPRPVHSAFDVGFDSAKTIGRSLSRAIASSTSGVKVPPTAATPMIAVGLQRLDRGEEVADRRMRRARTAACARRGRRGRLTTRPLRIDQPAAPRALPPRRGPPPPSPRRRDRRCRSPPRPRRGTACAARSSLPPVTRSAENMPASATAAVPWMSSLKVQMRSRYFCSSRKALWLAKSSNWITHAGKDLARGGRRTRRPARRRPRRVSRALRAGRCKADRRAALRCWCRRRASPAGTASGWMPAQAV